MDEWVTIRQNNRDDLIESIVVIIIIKRRIYRMGDDDGEFRKRVLSVEARWPGDGFICPARSPISTVSMLFLFLSISSPVMNGQFHSQFHRQGQIIPGRVNVAIGQATDNRRRAGRVRAILVALEMPALNPHRKVKKQGTIDPK